MSRLLYRAFASKNFQRATMAIVVALNLYNGATSDGWWRIMCIVSAVVLIAGQVLLEWTHRRTRDETWDFAALSSDPIGFLARADYFNRLTFREHKQLIDWVIEHEFRWTDEDVLDAPPVVRGWLELNEAPREQR